MKHLILSSLLVASFALPTHAEEPNPDVRGGSELIKRGLQQLLDGLAAELDPLAEDLSNSWQELVEGLGDLSQYHPPETLPNGDIIIRKKSPAQLGDPTEGETDI